MWLVMQLSCALDKCSHAASLHHLSAVTKLPSQQNLPDLCVRMNMFLCVCGCERKTICWSFLSTFGFLCVCVCVCVCVWGGGGNLCQLKQCMSKCACVCVPACQYLCVCISCLCLDVGKVQPAAKCCCWWLYDKIKHVAQRREEEEGWGGLRSREGGNDRSFGGEKNKGATSAGTYWS